MKSSEINKSIKKCEHCKQWTDGEKAFCSNCGEILDKKYREERAELEKEQQEGTPLMKIVKFKKSENSVFWRLLEKAVQSGQLVLIFFITLVIVVLGLLPG